MCAKRTYLDWHRPLFSDQTNIVVLPNITIRVRWRMHRLCDAFFPRRWVHPSIHCEKSIVQYEDVWSGFNFTSQYRLRVVVLMRVYVWSAKGRTLATTTTHWLSEEGQLTATPSYNLLNDFQSNQSQSKKRCCWVCPKSSIKWPFTVPCLSFWWKLMNRTGPSINPSIAAVGLVACC